MSCQRHLSSHGNHSWCVINDTHHSTRPLFNRRRNFLKRAGGPEYGPGKGGMTGGDRMATFIMMIHAPDQGGETVFPRHVVHTSGETKLDMVRRRQLLGEPAGFCDRDDVLKVKADPGDALLFWDYVPGEPEDRLVPDPFSLHGGCPVVEGTKNIVTRWIRSTEFV